MRFAITQNTAITMSKPHDIGTRNIKAQVSTIQHRVGANTALKHLTDFIRSRRFSMYAVPLRRLASSLGVLAALDSSQICFRYVRGHRSGRINNLVPSLLRSFRCGELLLLPVHLLHGRCGVDLRPFA